MKKLLIIGLTVVSYSSFAQEKVDVEKKSSVLEKTDIKNVTNENDLEDALEQKNQNKTSEKKIEKIEDVVFDLDFDKNLLSKEELNCYVPFSSWKKSVNFYDKCNINVKENNTIVINLMSLQNKIRVIYENDKHIFYDRLTMSLNVDCSKVTNNYKIENWNYYNREDKNYKKEHLDNVNWFLTASAENLGKETCEAKLPIIYNKAVDEHNERKERWRLAKENKEKEKLKKLENKKKVKKRIKKKEDKK